MSHREKKEDMVSLAQVHDMLEQQKIEMERAHRTGKPVTNRERPRPIVVKFVKFKDKLAISEKEKNLKGSNIHQ